MLDRECPFTNYWVLRGDAMRRSLTDKNLATGLLRATCVLMLVSLPLFSVNELGYRVDSVEIVVYRDGLAHVTHALTISEAFPAVNVELLASAIENVIVVDENSVLLDYEIVDFNLTLFSLGAVRALIEYDTVMLTRKKAGVWTLTLDNPYNLTIKLPEDSTIIHINEVPLAIKSEGNRTVLHLFPGHWEVSYVPPISPSTPAPPKTALPSTLIPLEYLVVAVISVAVVSSFALLKRRNPLKAEKVLKRYPEIRAEDKEAIRFIAEKGGKVFEAELREKFPKLPKTTVWRLVKRLEKKEIVTVKKIGLKNQVELRK